MKTGTKWVLGIGAAVIAREWYLASVLRSYKKIYGYAVASDRARATGKPLVVLGDPFAGNFNWFGKPDYPCGDMMIDIEAQEHCCNGIAEDVIELLPQMPDNSCVIYTSGTLEYIENLQDVLPEIYRVSGGDLYVTPLEAGSLKTALLTNFGYHFKRRYRVFTNECFELMQIEPI